MINYMLFLRHKAIVVQKYRSRSDSHFTALKRLFRFNLGFAAFVKC